MVHTCGRGSLHLVVMVGECGGVAQAEEKSAVKTKGTKIVSFFIGVPGRQMSFNAYIVI